MLVDLQDAGARYYTYLVHDHRGDEGRGAEERRRGGARPAQSRSAAWCRETCSIRHSPRRLVLWRSPMRHGMTLGELARLAKSDLHVEGSLSVVPVAGWRRADRLRSRPGCRSFRPVPTSGRSRASSTIRGSVCSREPTSRSAEALTLRSSRSGRPGSTRRACSPTCARRSCRGFASAESPSPRRAGRREVRRHRSSWEFGSTRHRPDAATTRPRRRYTCSPPFGRRPPDDSPGFRHSSTDWPAVRASGRRIDAGNEPSAIVAGWSAGLERFNERRKDVLVVPE